MPQRGVDKDGNPYKNEGRKGATRTKLRAMGLTEEANAIAPPSEKLLTEEERCGARLANGADHTCRAAKGKSTLHPGYGYCSRHGGNTEAGVKSAMREMGRDLAAQYKAEFSRFGGDRRDPSIANLTPEQALLEEVRRSAAMVRFLEERIGTWDLAPADAATIEAFATAPRTERNRLADLKQEVTRIIEDLRDDVSSPTLPPLTHTNPNTGITSFTDAREWLYLYREERGHLARVAKMSIDAGVAQRLVSIAEDQGRILATAIRAVLRALNLTPDQAALVPQVVPPILRAVATDSPIPELNIVEGKVLTIG